MNLHRPNQRCRRCPERAERTIGTAAICLRCAEGILGPIRDRVLEREGAVDRVRPDGVDVPDGAGLAGVGRVTGRWRSELGLNVFELTCDRCRAGWQGAPGDRCDWCVKALGWLIEDQTRVMLTAPDMPGMDLDDARRPGLLRWWAHRLRHAVEAGIVTRAQADRAWRQEVAGECAA